MVISIPKKKKKGEKNNKPTLVKEKRWVFEGSAGWLLFWLVVVPPVGYIWLLFSMKRKEFEVEVEEQEGFLYALGFKNEE